MSAVSCWTTAPIADWGIDIIDGDRSGNYPKDGDFVAEGVPFLNTTNIRDGALDLTDLRFITQQKWDSIKKGRANPGDILMTTRGTIGRVARFNCRYTSALINAQMLILRSDPAVLDSNYLFYVLRSDGVQSLLRAFSSGSAQPQIPIRDLRCVPITLPPLETQIRIASILVAYDDLIEVNRRRVAVLEEMARGLFEEWFVRFRFPRYESVPIIETAQGPLPQGWTWGAFCNLAPEVRDTVSPSEVPGNLPYVGLEHIPRRSTTLDDHGQAIDATSLKARFRRGDILFGKIRPYFHKVAWAPFSGVASTDAIIWRPDLRFAAQALAVASSESFVAHAVQSSNGTKMPRANPKVLAAYRCALASAYISQQYEAVAAPMIEMAAGLQAANVRLAASRDLLLPRLISGRISVESAQNELEQAA